jgi:hypothetical protein
VATARVTAYPPELAGPRFRYSAHHAQKLAFFGSTQPLLHSFRYACTCRPVFMALYLRQLQAWGFAVEERFLGGSWRRYCGDLVSLGKGEILTWQEN